jgi:LmbE family N-acetylglucosaminyl deacetylase
VETAYLSLTRGDGGQNLIGNELGEALGVIRTEELLAARRLDGAHQYFTRAYDFGFSKSAEETFRHWPKDSVLNDVVTVVRAFRPHVIISIWSGTPADGHGQHQASGILAREAYEVSGDTVRFPVARFGPAWVASKLYRAAGYRREGATLVFNVGEYDPLLGRSYAEIAGESRSQHKSQGQGTPQRKGAVSDAVQRLATRVAAPADPARETSLFEGMDTTWGRVRSLARDARARAALDSLPQTISVVRRAFSLLDPESLVPALSRVQRLLYAVCQNPSSAIECGPSDRSGDLARTVSIAARRADSALQVAGAVALEASVDREAWPAGGAVPVTLTIFNRGRSPISYLQRMDDAGVGRWPRRTILPDSALSVQVSIRADSLTRPWWMLAPRTGDIFASPVSRIAEDQRDIAARAGAVLAVGATRDEALERSARAADSIRFETADAEALV